MQKGLKRERKNRQYLDSSERENEISAGCVSRRRIYTCAQVRADRRHSNTLFCHQSNVKLDVPQETSHIDNGISRLDMECNFL